MSGENYRVIVIYRLTAAKPIPPWTYLLALKTVKLYLIQLNFVTQTAQSQVYYSYNIGA